MTMNLKFDPELDLKFERVVNVPPSLIWKAWTTPILLLEWFTPAPWRTIECELDVRPGGLFSTTMLSPEGQQYPNVGCYLEVVKDERLVWTNALGPGFRPSLSPASAAEGGFKFTGVISLVPEGEGTRYTAMVIHADAETRKTHEAMGFQEGWGKALDQLIEVVKGQS
jgi:uncharacterized protein YndB with AHSA1/START domain